MNWGWHFFFKFQIKHNLNNDRNHYLWEIVSYCYVFVVVLTADIMKMLATCFILLLTNAFILKYNVAFLITHPFIILPWEYLFHSILSLSFFQQTCLPLVYLVISPLELHSHQLCQGRFVSSSDPLSHWCPSHMKYCFTLLLRLFFCDQKNKSMTEIQVECKYIYSE